MVEFEVTGTTVTVHVSGAHRVLALREQVTFDLRDVRRVSIAPVDLRPPWVRAPGTFFPGVIAAGVFRGKGRKEFWDTRFDEHAIQIDLSGGDYTRLVVDVPEPYAALGWLSATLAA
ncbi:hypothetical protein [Nocardia huaxiensis]|uniref:Bacterial Pleckstrin homology domain-containing protein n=1 Tax=Nocardia huaxiensis TaxID=2755382 RepID=A0A7D6Z9B4_9NOCA|nr:hypothetical protein [Nocardia huaxiensis]QLY28198.1 hypothetical protein H0264_22700 [Nocardia huaxiensis]UFS98367.1 hypothetical protein LPY97_10935 [Nocardia huaxiensis]